MRKLIFISCLILSFILSTNVKAQNFFDTTSLSYNEGLKQTVYKPSKFENFLKQQVRNNLKGNNKVLLFTMKYGFLARSQDSSINGSIYEKYILLTYKGDSSWFADKYINVRTGFGKHSKDTFMKSATVEIKENDELYNLRNNWDSLKNDWYLPFVQEAKSNGKIGYFPSEASDCSTSFLYAISDGNVIYKNIYSCDVIKEWHFNDLVIKNLNYDYDYAQPTFAAIVYLSELFNYESLFKNYKVLSTQK